MALIPRLSRFALASRTFGARLLDSIAPLAMLAVSAALGVVLAHLFRGMGSPWIWAAVAACSAVVFARHRATWALCVFVAIGYGLLHSMSLTELERIPHREAMLAGQRFYVTVIGVVEDEPRQLSGGASRFPLRLESMRDRQGKKPCEARVLVTIAHPDPAPLYGDRLVIDGALSIPSPTANPGQFDMRAWFLRRRISAELFASGSSAAVVAHGRGNALMAAALKCREWIRQRLTMGLESDPDTASVIAAMVLGTRSETPDEIEDAFIGSGTMHVFAVSGLHVGLFACLAWMFLKAIGLRRPVAIALIIPGIVFYAFVTGLRPSACRATIMAVIMLAGYLCDRVPSLANSLGAAALVILFADTLQLLQPGFQLSFIVLGSIVALAPVLRAPFKKVTRPDPFLPKSLLTSKQRIGYAVGRRISDIFTVSCAAWLGSVLLMFYHFEIVTPVAIVANCFLVPCAFVVLFISSVSLVLGGLAGNWIGILCNNANWLVTKATVWLAALFAGFPGGGMRAARAPGEIGSLHATVLHMEHGGGCAHVAVNGGSEWFLDIGHASDLRGIVLPYLKSRNVEAVDAILLSHADSGHIGGALRAIEQTDPRALIISGQTYRSPAFRALQESDGNVDIVSRFEVVSSGREFDLGRGAVARILFPPEQGRPIALADDQAIVVQIDHLGWRLLFMQDAGFSTEKWLLRHCRYLDSDVLIKGRHRTDYSGLPEFLDAVSPRAVVATNAPFPAGEQIPDDWRAMVENRGIRLFDQTLTGAVTIEVTPGELALSSFTGSMRCVLKN